MKLHAPSVAYAFTTLAATMMHSVFNFYYVKVYLNRFHVSESWFHFAQILFMVWNALNDPLFGYIQDNYDFSWVKSRRHSILYGAPLFALSFVLPWFPWGDYETYTWLSGFQLLVSLCFYDTMFTFVLLAQCSLFAEMSTAQEDRVRLIRYTQIASLVGSSAVFFTGLISENLTNYGAFQACTIVIGLFAFMCLTYSGRNAHSQYDSMPKKGNGHSETEVLTKKGNGTHRDEDTSPSKRTGTHQYSMFQQIYQLLTQPSFICFVLMNFCQVYHVTFLGNFASVFGDALIGKDELPARPRSFFYGSLSLLAQVVMITFTPVVRRVGYYTLVRYSFVVKIAMGVWVIFFGSFWWGIAIYFLLESVFTGATFSLFNLPLSDVIDVDKDKYKRKQPLSSMVFGTNALVTKPAQSVAPMLTVSVLNRFGYAYLDTKAGPNLAPAELQWAMVLVCSATSIVLGILQTIIWSRYTIRTSHHTIAKYVES